MTEILARLSTALADRYKIEGQLGEGGMATVYLAGDLKHKRKVAVKVLRPELAAILGAERFLKEIEVTANLQHPNILPLYDSGVADTFLYYVMPYIEGETLRDKLNREKQLAVEETVEIAKSVAGALSFAHERGVIHRDIKPENILLQSGQALVADFGIALAVTQAGGTRLTETGLSLGTPHYMSPEQATGDRELDARSDVYSLACVTYEMLTGDPPHTGSTAQAIIASVMTEEPRRVTQRRKTVPAHVEAAVHKALEKLPADRFPSAHDFAQALADPGFRHGALGGAVAGVSPSPWNRRSITTAITTMMLAVTVVVLASRWPERLTPDVVRLSVPIAQDDSVYLGGILLFGRPLTRSLALSPDGDLLVYAATATVGGSRLYMRRWDQEAATPIAGTEGASGPFFSPDGAWIGFRHLDGLKRVSLADGNIEMIFPGSLSSSLGVLLGAAWGDNGMIVLSFRYYLVQVAATGGELELLSEADSLPGGRPRYGRPHMLPGNEVLLVDSWRSWDPARAEIVALDLATGRQKTVLTDAMEPLYVQTGHLLFMRQGTLMAVAFDLDQVEVQGQPVVMVEDVMHSISMPNRVTETGAAQVAVSASGHLAYARGGIHPGSLRAAVRLTPPGDTVLLDMGTRGYGQFRVSPEGNRLAFTEGRGLRRGIWVHDLIRGVTQRLNTGGFSDIRMEWSPDGRFLAFSSDRDQAVWNIYRLPADGSGEPERLTRSDRRQGLSSWSSEGVIAWLEGGDIWVLPPDGDPTPFFTSAEGEQYPTFSPDGQWLAYRAPAGIYVRPYPGPEPAIQISNGGASPAWSPDGREIYYIRNGILTAVAVTPGDEFQVGRPRVIVEPWIFRITGPVRSYDVFPDGSFVGGMRDRDGRSFPERFGVTELHVILNFFEELKARVGN